MRVITVITLLILIPHALASHSSSDYSVSLGGSGASIMSSQSYGISSHDNIGFLVGGDKDFNEWSIGSRVLTNNGYSAVEASDSYSAENASISKNKLFITYDSGAVYDNTYYMGDNQPNVPEVSCKASNMIAGSIATTGINPSDQSVELHKSGIAGYGQYESNTIIDDANMTSDTTNEFGGGGLYTETKTELIEVGFDKNSSEMNFKRDAHSHYGKVSHPDDNETSTFVSDYKYRDFSSPFGIGNETESNMTNSTP